MYIFIKRGDVLMNLFNNKKNSNQIKNNAQSHTYNQQSAEGIKPTLSLHPGVNIPLEDRYIYQYHNNEADPLEPNQLSIMVIDYFVRSGAIDVRALIRHSLDKPIQLQKTLIVMMNDKHEVIGEEAFNLSNLGELPACSSRPFTFRFNKKELKESIDEQKRISLGFKLQPKHQLDLSEEHKQQFTKAQISYLEKIVKSAPNLKDGEFNIMPTSHEFLEDESLAISLLLRNGSNSSVKLEQLPLQVYDNDHQIVAKGAFTLEDFEVKANTSKLHTFIFPKDAIILNDSDLSQFTVGLMSEQ